MRVIIDRAAVEDIENDLLAWALFDSYFGENPVSANAKAEIAAMWPKFTKRQVKVVLAGGSISL